MEYMIDLGSMKVVLAHDDLEALDSQGRNSDVEYDIVGCVAELTRRYTGKVRCCFSTVWP